MVWSSKSTTGPEKGAFFSRIEEDARAQATLAISTAKTFILLPDKFSLFIIIFFLSCIPPEDDALYYFFTF